MNNFTPLRIARTGRDGAPWRTLLSLSVLLAVLPFTGASSATDTISPAWSVDIENTATPSGAMYARVRHLVGDIELLQEDEMLETNLTLNTPVAAGDIVSTGNDSLVEVQLADGTLVRLDEYTRLHVVTLSDLAARYENRTILALDEGTISIQVGEFDPEEKMLRVDTDAATIFFLTDGLFRIDVNAGGGTRVTSKRGVAEILAEDTSVLVRSGEMSFVAPGYGAEGPRVISTRPRDDFDRYVEERRLAYLGQARRRDYAQYEDDLPEPVRPYLVELDTYGEWHDHSSYGVIWVPRVAVGWRPYQRGRWHSRPVGNVWVSTDPWGYAPYHYGRWEHLPGYGWSWLPGAVYAPAWVSWGYYTDSVGWAPLGYYNYPSGWSISIGFGSFHSSYWSFVDYGHFNHHAVHSVVRHHDSIDHDRVHYASRPPRVQRDHGQARGSSDEFRRQARDATSVAAVTRRRVDLSERGQNFRRSEAVLARSTRRTAGANAADSGETGGSAAPTRARGGRIVGDTDDRRSTPAVSRETSGTQSPRATDVRGRSRVSTRRGQSSGNDGQTTPAGSGEASSSRDTGQAREPGRTALGRTTRRPVAETEPRRLIEGARTRRTPASTGSSSRAGSSSKSETGKSTSSAGKAESSRRSSEATKSRTRTPQRRDADVRRPAPDRKPPASSSRGSSSRTGGSSAKRSAPPKQAPPKQAPPPRSRGRSGSDRSKKDDSRGGRVAATNSVSRSAPARSVQRPGPSRTSTARPRTSSSRPTASAPPRRAATPRASTTRPPASSSRSRSSASSPPRRPSSPPASAGAGRTSSSARPKSSGPGKPSSSGRRGSSSRRRR